MKQTIVRACLLLMAAIVVTAQDYAAKAREYLKAQETVNGFSGSVLLAKNGSIILNTGVGLASRELNVPNGPDTKFRLGSITKQFTATSIMLLEQRSKLNVTDLISKYIPDAPEAWKDVTVHHLLCHQSGIPSYTNDPAYGRNMFKPMPLPELIGGFRGKPLEFAPGSQFKYDNSGYVLLGDIIERVSGEKYEEFLNKNIFEPLKMSNSGYDHFETILPNRAAGYSKQGARFRNAAYLDMSQPHAAGSLYSTVNDLALWDAALYTDKVLPQAVLNRMFTPNKSGYGYGWTIAEEAGMKLIGHGGGINGFSTFIGRIPQDRSLMLVLSNVQQANASGVARDLGALIHDRPYDVPKVRQQISMTNEAFDAFVGTYQLSPAFSIRVYREGNRFLTQAPNQPPSEIFPETPNSFFLKVVEAQITFERDAGGKVTQMILRQGGRSQPGKRIE
ncbi:MAG: serine hydrolase [Candidatus Solibacter usitatus]|nr:serine hydrolase [Candidatus Solibacter usitatus]